MIRFARLIMRLCAMGCVILSATIDYFFSVQLRRNAYTARLAWMQRLARNFLMVANVRVEVAGDPPKRGLLVSNHLSYLDIIVLGSITRMAFVSKLEVRAWPVFGWLSCLAGTLFIDRRRKLDVERVTGEMTGLLGSGIVVALFPEGTSSDGSRVLPFRSSLLEPAVSHRWPVTPACLVYEIPGGSAATEVCYWGDLSFFPHLLNLLSKQGVRAKVAFGRTLEPVNDRKQLASRLHDEVVALKKSISREPVTPRVHVTGETKQGLAR